MSMNDHEITDLVRQMAKPPAPPTYTDADVEELVRMHAGGRHKMRSEAEILARYNLGRKQYKQLKGSHENNREQQQMLYAELKVLGWILGRKEREVVMEQAREVTKFERIAFPIVSTIFISLLLPSIASLLGMLMLGNLFRESGVTDRLSDTAQNALINTVTIFLALGTGLTMSAESFLVKETLMIIGLGLVAFIFGTAAGVVLGKIMCRATGWKVNPLIGSA